MRGATKTAKAGILFSIPPKVKHSQSSKSLRVSPSLLPEMKVVALVSGGKDSCYTMMKCLQYGHQIVALANLLPADDSVDELDSYMYQTVGHQIIESLAQCMGLPLFRRRIRGSTRHHNLSYRPTPGDEVEDMYILLKEVKRQIPSVQAVSSGAIASDYQRLRVESVCSRLGLVSLAYLWKQDQSWLLQQMIDGGIVAIIVKVAAIGLDPAKHLGKELSSLFPYLHKLKELYGINVCGEGGEYESLTLDCPLFTNARIELDEFQIVLHSPDSIAPVGILHPLTFHLEDKVLGDHDKANDLNYKKMGLVHEVQDDYLEGNKDPDGSAADVIDLAEVMEDRLKISMTERGQTFSITCWLQDSCQVSSGLQDDLKDVLRKIEARLAGNCLGWKDVLYIHLYIADMNKFAVANETYVKFITQEKCHLGVPSRSTIELPLLEVGLGKAYIEVLVTNNESKRVLHVQSISCWAPSCIGPYSQATFHQNVLYMAGQLGLDPPTMNLCSGGLSAELEQAILNSEAVAKSFNLSIATSSIMLVIYCSAAIPPSERCKIQEKVDTSLKRMQTSYLDKGSPKVLDPIFLYVLVPNLPKGALVEIKPVLYAVDDEELTMSSSVNSGTWGFQHESWHESCVQKCIVSGRICTITLCITSEVAAKICSDYHEADPKSEDTSEVAAKICSDYHDADPKSEDPGDALSKRQMEPVSRFCVYVLDKVLVEHCFSWEDVMSLRIYFPTRLRLPLGTLSHIFSNVFEELAETGRGFKSAEDSIFNLVPVVGAGSCSASMEDLLTCELFAQR